MLRSSEREQLTMTLMFFECMTEVVDTSGLLLTSLFVQFAICSGPTYTYIHMQYIENERISVQFTLAVSIEKCRRACGLAVAIIAQLPQLLHLRVLT